MTLTMETIGTAMILGHKSLLCVEGLATWKTKPPEANPKTYHRLIRVAPLSFVHRSSRCAFPRPSQVLPSWMGVMANSEAEKASNRQSVTSRIVTPEVVVPEAVAPGVIRIRFHYSAMRQCMPMLPYSEHYYLKVTGMEQGFHSSTV